MPDGSQLPETKTKSYYQKLGPGLVTGAADDDPSGIATYSQAGAQTGFQFLWLALFTLPFMIVVQEMCARIGIVTGEGLATNIRKTSSRNMLMLCVALLFITNTFNIGADLVAMASASALIFPTVPVLIFIVFFALLSVNLQVFIPYRKYAPYLKWLTFALFFYVITAFFITLPWREILTSVVIPHFTFSKANILLLTAILGTTISPYLFFWQTSQEVEEEIKDNKPVVTGAHIQAMRFDVGVGMIVSNVVMLFIIIVCGGVLFTHGITTIHSASEAALALKPLAGRATYILFTLGIVGTGLLALPVLAGATSYAIAETMHWHEGLYRVWKNARGFYNVILISVGLGVLLSLFHFNPIKMLLYAAVLNGLAAPILLFCILKIANNSTLMGSWKNTRMRNIIGWSICGIMAAVGCATLVSLW